ncbi:hypothetical protein [Buchananella hordeovulneris]|uniref:hypothetical protein n=1 Tax=Buchananella hordeovulneris TaxID=52770 RepID=UPI000F5E1803|nr:hypothetical protein [Buchananella hordeovulneris]RRD44961.1 hypothetical protein EII13_02005 [Buchananella hordeovulneris]
MKRLSVCLAALSTAVLLTACSSAAPSASLALSGETRGGPGVSAAPSASPTPGPTSEALVVLERVLAANGGSIALALEHTTAFWRVELLDADGAAREYRTDAAGQIIASELLPPPPHAAATFADTPISLADALRTAGGESLVEASLTVYRNQQVWRIAADETTAVHVDAKSGQLVE